MNKKLIAVLATLAIAGGGVILWGGETAEQPLEVKVSVADVQCKDEAGKAMVAAEEMILRAVTDGEVIEVAKVCFKTKKEYTDLKNDLINSYVNATPEERARFLLTNEGRVLGDVLTHETEKVGMIEFELQAGEDLILKYIEAVNKL